MYSISKGGSHGGDIHVPPGCIVENLIDGSNGELQNFLLSNNREEHYLCDSELISMKPEGGMLGDIQINADGVVNFMTNEIICTADTGNKALCRYPPPFINKLRNLCHKPEELGIRMDVSTNDLFVSWLLSGTARVTLKCDRELPLVGKTNMCRNSETRFRS